MSVPKLSGNVRLEEADPEIFDLIEKEKERQFSGIELIASENFTSQAVLDALGSVMTNKYSEGLPGARYYGGNQVIDQVERLCQKRALAAFHLDESQWGVNVQPYSGSPANFEVYTALLQPHDRIMGLDLPSGGHLTHGFYTAKKKISASSIYFESLPYQVDSATGYIDHDKLREQAKLFRPKLIIAGASAYPRDWDYAKFKAICDEVGAFFMVDMAHYSGLVATQEHNNPFEFADVVTSTTHKSLRGPRSGIIFYRKPRDGKWMDLEDRINQAVFPSCQGGPHNNTIAALAVQLKEVASPEFKSYVQQLKRNAVALANALMEFGYKLVTNGTENHLILWDVRPLGLTGNKVEKVCDAVAITLNKNSVYGDASAIAPGGVRIGTPAMTTRGLKEEDFVTVAQFLHRVIQITLAIQERSGKKLTDFVAALAQGDSQLDALKHDVETFSRRFGFPGLDTATMRYNPIANQ
eukprot:GILK01000702.1.p1 GENE.GILK01000702.1~~GILK01000702.1.p1  ORF type:complete len:480 (-),score=93.28 GILK01000702.1:255-1658(-)